MNKIDYYLIGLNEDSESVLDLPVTTEEAAMLMLGMVTDGRASIALAAEEAEDYEPGTHVEVSPSPASSSSKKEPKACCGSLIKNHKKSCRFYPKEPDEKKATVADHVPSDVSEDIFDEIKERFLELQNSSEVALEFDELTISDVNRVLRSPSYKAYLLSVDK